MSFSPETEKLVEQLIQAEYLNACEIFGEKYNSLHEGYAVLLEEVEEVLFEKVKLGINDIWYGIKKNNGNMISYNQEEMLFNVKNAISELAQVGVVLMKIKNTLEVEE